MGRDAERTALFINEMLGGVFSRIWMVLSVIALMKIAMALSLKARVEVLEELKDDLSEEERDAIVANVKRRALHRCPMRCPMSRWMDRSGTQ